MSKTPELAIIAGPLPKDTFQLKYDVIDIGRGGCYINLPDRRVSRRHARIVCKGKHFKLENFSRNGTYKNGEKVDTCFLEHGDRLKIGDTLFIFHSYNNDGAKTEVGMMLSSKMEILTVDVDEKDLAALRRAKRDLVAIYKAGKVINSIHSSSDLFSKSLEIVLSEIKKVDCCSIHILEERTGRLVCEDSCLRNEKSSEGNYFFSNTILKCVLSDLNSILIEDASEDDRVEGAMSIVNMSIHSTMCVPLQSPKRLIGVIQANSLNPLNKFNEDDLRFLTAIGNLVGSALENALLYETLEEERNKQKDKAKFLQIMLHDLKSPLAATKMIVDSISQGYVPEDQVDKFHERIGARLDEMRVFVQNALELSKLETGDYFGNVEEMDLCEEVPRLCESQRELADGKNLDFEMHVHDSPVIVKIDPWGLRAIVDNVVGNGIKYTTEGRVDVTVGIDDGCASIRVEDTGIGIPEQDKGSILKTFYRASNAKKRKMEGTGVGLSGIKNIIERYNGELRVSSEVNVGSTFTVILPLGDKPIFIAGTR